MQMPPVTGAARVNEPSNSDMKQLPQPPICHVFAPHMASLIFIVMPERMMEGEHPVA